MQKKTMLAALCTVIATGPLYAAEVEPPIAMDGFCPVCLMKMNKLVKGDPKFSSAFDGRTFLFPSAEQKRMFDANPTAFAPAFGGDCTVCMVEMGEHVAGKPEFFLIREQRLFLFPSEKQKRMFEENPQKYEEVDLALDGNCPVCIVRDDELVAGREEYASIYDGMRFLFPSPKQKHMFDAKPAAYVPAFHGNCTVCKVEKNKTVAGKAEFRTIHEGRLFVFPSRKQLNMFTANPDRYEDVDIAMDGFCAVSKFDFDKKVKGRPEFFVDHHGWRFLFTGEEQRDKFIANPDKYAPDMP